MRKEKYSYYDSKLVTKKAEALREEYLKDVEKELGKEYRNIEIGFVYVAEDEQKTWIKHEFEYKGKVEKYYGKTFYELYDLVIGIVK